jgi:hypothetical protein
MPRPKKTAEEKKESRKYYMQEYRKKNDKNAHYCKLNYEKTKEQRKVKRTEREGVNQA